jgi:hypothetical protein
MYLNRSRGFQQDACVKINLGLSMPKGIGGRRSGINLSRSLWASFLKLVDAERYWGSTIGESLYFFVNAYSFSLLSMPKGSVIDDILV